MSQHGFERFCGFACCLHILGPISFPCGCAPSKASSNGKRIHRMEDLRKIWKARECPTLKSYSDSSHGTSSNLCLPILYVLVFQKPRANMYSIITTVVFCECLNLWRWPKTCRSASTGCQQVRILTSFNFLGI
jgi:hypothetical protein